MSNENRGIIVSGGTLTANEMAVGEHATINKVFQVSSGVAPTIQELRNELDLLITKMEQNQIEHDKIAAMKAINGELAKDSPNMLIVKPVLHSVIDSIKMIGTVAGAALSVKKILDLLGHDHRLGHNNRQVSDRGMRNQPRLNKKIDDLQLQWELLNEKLSGLNTQEILETRPEEKLRLRKSIEETKTQRDQIEEKLKDMENQLCQG